MVEPFSSTARRGVAVAAALGVLAVAGGTVGASEGGAHRDAKLHWQGVPGSVNVVVGSLFCDPQSPSRCVAPYTNTSVWSGDVTAHQAQAGAIVRVDASGEFDSTASSWVTGTVVGCPGTGSFALTWHTRSNADGSSDGTGSVVEASGIDGLAGLRGSFAVHVTIDEQGRSVPFYEGKLRCDGR